MPESLGNLTSLTMLDLKGNRLTSVPESLGNLTSLTMLDLKGNRLTSVPESLGNLTGLTMLDLKGNRLTSVPESLGNLTGLTDLDLSGNQLTSVPEWLGNLTGLTMLDLKGNRLTSVPEWLGNLTGLTDLDLNGNQLTSLPGWLGNLTALTRLGLGGSQLASVPEWLGNLTGLTDLGLSGNQLASVPEWLGNLTGLTDLDLNRNQLTSVPEWLGNLTGLTRLDLGENKLTSVPEWLGNLTGLTGLSLGGSQLASAPEWLGNLTGLTALDLGGNQLTSLPEWFGNLTALTVLDLNGNQLTSLPESLGNLTGLTVLYLDGNQLTSVPEWLGNLTSLTALYLGGNQLTSPPEWFENLTSLTALYLNGNQLTSLPEWFGNLTSLTQLHLTDNQLTSLPESLGNLTGLTALYLDGNQLTSVPEWFGNLTGITQLHLNGNQLTSLPESLGNLTGLTDLHLTENELTSLPEWFGNLTSLTALYLDGNQLTSPPESLGKLPSLTDLDLSRNQLTSLPEWFGNLTSLTQLHLTDNQLTSLPESLGSLTGLTALSLTENQLTSLPESLGNLTGLTELYLTENQLTSLPESLANLTGLTELYLMENRLTSLPDSLGNLASLSWLDLDGNQLASVPESLGNLVSVTNLDLRRNKLANIPESLSNLARLRMLFLMDNELTSVPEWLGRLTGLTELHLSGNQLTSVPEWLGNLTGITELRLSGNQLTSLPESLGNLTGLTTLDLSGNQLTSVPESLGNLANLAELTLDGNPLRSPLLEIAEDGTAAVKAYLSLLMDHAAELWMSKLLVVGEGAVGKTSLVRALAGDQFDKNESTTHGIRIREIELRHPARSDVRMHLSSWDFGGQDIYHATHQFFLSDRSLFVLLWNARQGWEQAKLPYWLDIIQARAPRARVILVATHAEGRPVDLPLNDLRAAYPQIIGNASVDNSNGDGIDELRLQMADEAAQLPLMGSWWPATWITAVDVIRTCELQYATPEELSYRLATAGVTDRSHQTYLLRALHVLGDILYFEDDEELKDTVILRPQWVNDYIAKVLDSPEVATRHGLLTRSHEQSLWSDLAPGLRDRFLKMMEKFDLSYRTADDPTAASLVVERLPWDNPPYEEFWGRALADPGAHEIRLRYHLNTLPPGVPTWFIAREHRFTTGTHWRTGALLRYTSDPRVYSLIRAERKDNTVDLAVRGPVPQLFFSVLQDGLESTLRRYQGLEISRLVPCTCDWGDGTQSGEPCMHLYQYDPLLRRLERGVPEVECELSFSKVNVAELLFGIAPATTDQLVSWMGKVDRKLTDFRAESAWAQREFLKAFRRGQVRSEALCPSVFTLTAAPSRLSRPGVQRLELRLYCEQPGAFHAVPEPPYIISQPTRWLRAIGPYLTTLVQVLKHTAPLAGPVLGITAEHLAKQLTNEVRLMTELVNQLPRVAMDSGITLPQGDEPQRRASLDVDYRAIYSLLDELDSSHHWAGLNRILSPEDQILWLCSDHARQYDI